LKEIPTEGEAFSVLRFLRNDKGNGKMNGKRGFGRDSYGMTKRMAN